VHAKPVHKPMAPIPILNARMHAAGKPRPQYMPRLIVAPIFCLPHPRNTPARTVLAPSPAVFEWVIGGHKPRAACKYVYT